jgi:hypothetical protein
MPVRFQASNRSISERLSRAEAATVGLKSSRIDRSNRSTKANAREANGVRNGQYGPPTMRLLVARCEVTYTGRMTAQLPEATRLLVLKADGLVLVHDDCGGYKPLNSIRKEFRPKVG